jgi:hypothetical protein
LNAGRFLKGREERWRYKCQTNPKIFERVKTGRGTCRSQPLCPFFEQSGAM